MLATHGDIVERWLHYVASAQLVLWRSTLHMRHDMMSCGYVEKIKRHGLATKERVASVKGKLKARVRWTVEAVKREYRAWRR